MGILDRKWVRALFSIGISIVTIAIFFTVAMTVSDSIPRAEHDCIGYAFFFGAPTIIGILLFYIAADLIDKDNAIVKILRFILIGIGALLIVGCGGSVLIVYSGMSKNFGDANPWVCAFGGMWFLNGLAAGICFFFAAENDAREYMPFIQVVTLLGSYILFVIFAYLGKYVHFFFYGWLFVILCVALIVFIIIGLVKTGGVDLPTEDDKDYKNEDNTDDKDELEIIIYDKDRDVTKNSEKLSLNTEYRIALKTKKPSNVINNYDDINVFIGNDQLSIPLNARDFEMDKCKKPSGFIVKSKSLEKAELTFEYNGKDKDKRKIRSASCTLCFH